MEEIYFDLVKVKKRTCNENNKKVRLVPESYREQVKQMLDERGLDYDGNPKQS